MIKTTIITSAFRSEPYLKTFLNELTFFSDIKDLEFLLLLVNPSPKEMQLCDNAKNLNIVLNIHVIKQIESLYATWNRGIKLAKGDYVGIWNVDDIRNPTGLKEQISILERSKDVALVFGDIYYCLTYGDKTGKMVMATKSDEIKTFLEGSHLTCFPLWRKEIHQFVGYFDEQLNIAGDWDFQIRVALKYKMISTIEHLGWYLIADKKKLSSNYKKLLIEQTVIGIRYKNYKIIHLLYIISAMKFYEPSIIKSYNINRRLFDIPCIPKGFRINQCYLMPLILIFRDFFIVLKRDILKPLYFKILNLLK